MNLLMGQNSPHIFIFFSFRRLGTPCLISRKTNFLNLDHYALLTEFFVCFYELLGPRYYIFVFINHLRIPNCRHFILGAEDSQLNDHIEP